MALLGIGDDCAVVPVPRGHEALITTDFSLENVHFKRAWHPPESVGHRCLARGLSDIAAMGGEPLAVFLSLAVAAELAAELGGWIPARSADAGGRVQGEPGRRRHGRVSRRHSGGYRRAGLGAEGQGGVAVGRTSGRPDLCDRRARRFGGDDRFALRRKKLRRSDFGSHFFPRPRVEVGRFLREKGLASAMIDISDGLSTDLGHICEESGVGAELEVKLFRSRRWGNRRGRSISGLPCMAGRTTSCCSLQHRGKEFRRGLRALRSGRSGW